MTSTGISSRVHTPAECASVRGRPALALLERERLRQVLFESDFNATEPPGAPNGSNANLRGQGPRSEVERRAGCDGRRDAALR
jgi:hypothetical protein